MSLYGFIDGVETCTMFYVLKINCRIMFNICLIALKFQFVLNSITIRGTFSLIVYPFEREGGTKPYHNFENVGFENVFLWRLLYSNRYSLISLEEFSPQSIELKSIRCFCY